MNNAEIQNQSSNQGASSSQSTDNAFVSALQEMRQLLLKDINEKLQKQNDDIARKLQKQMMTSQENYKNKMIKLLPSQIRQLH